MKKIWNLLIVSSLMLIVQTQFIASNNSTIANENVSTTTPVTIATTIINDKFIKIKNDSAISFEEDSFDIRIPQQSTLKKFQILERTSKDSVPETCGTGNIKLEENEKSISSPDFPKPYPIPFKQNYTITIDTGTSIEFTIHCLNINPLNDYLKIIIESLKTDEPIAENEVIVTEAKPIIMTGLLKKPISFRALSSQNITIEFQVLDRDPNEGPPVTYTGFFITYKPYGEIIPPPTMPPDVTVPFDKLETINQLLLVDRTEQSKNETWLNMKKLLCEATNQYLTKLVTNQTIEPCYIQNVTFTTISHCPQQWPNSIDCIEIYIAIQLYATVDSMTTIDPYQNKYEIERMPRQPIGLNHTALSDVWNNYAEEIFKKAGYLVYHKTESNHQLLLWLSIVVGIILIFFIIGVVILKSGIIKNKWVQLEEEDEKKEYKSNNDIDITMYPSPDQVVPELFPSHTNHHTTSNIYGNEIGYNIDNGRIPSVLSSNGGRRISTDFESSQMIEEGFNPAFIEDEDERIGSSFRMRVNGVNRDEANT